MAKLKGTIILFALFFAISGTEVYAQENVDDLKNISNQLQVTINLMVNKGNADYDYNKEIRTVTSALNYTFDRILKEYSAEKDQQDRLDYSELLTIASVFNTATENLKMYNTTKDPKFLQKAISYKVIGDNLLLVTR